MKLKTKDSCGKDVAAGWTDASDMNVYAFEHQHDIPVRVADDYGDTIFSHMETVTCCYHVAARTPELASALYKLHHPEAIYKHLSGPTPVLIIDAMVETGKLWSSHP